jgi:hypothetical protein
MSTVPPAKLSARVLLVAVATFALTQGSWEAAKSLLAVFPLGVNAKVDDLVDGLSVLRVAGYVILAAAVAACAWLWRRERTAVAALVAGAVLAAIAPPYAIFFVALVPAWLIAIKQPVATRVDAVGEAGAAACAIALGAVALMTLATPFPHQMSVADVFYMIGTGAVSMLVVAAVAWMGLGFYRWAVRWPQATLAAKLTIAGLVYWYLERQFFGIFSRLDSSFDYGPFAGFAAVGLALLLASLCDESEGRVPMRAWVPWTVGIAVAVRIAFAWFKRSEKDIPTLMAGDVLSLVTPLLVGAMAVGLARRGRLDSRRYRALGAAAAIFAFGTMFYATIQDADAWVTQVENNRPFALQLSENKRYFLGQVRLAPRRNARELYFSLEERVSAAAAQSAATPEALGALQSQAAASTAGDRPHIFMFVSDATARARMGAYGYARDNTPNLTAFAHKALLFSRHQATASDTLQNVLSIYSGQYTGRKTWLDNKQRTRLCELLHSLGYRMFIAGGMRPYGVGSDDSFCATARPLSFFGNEPGDYARIATSLTENPSIPHFVYVHVNGGHNPWQVDKADQVFGSHPLDVYDAMIRVADRQFGEMLSFIEQQNVQDKVITLFTADHGIGFGDHFDLCSYSNVYATNVNIPFVLRAPGKAPAKIDAVTSHIDVLPTLHQLLTGQVPAHLPGQPMLTAVPQEGAGRCVFSIAAYNDAYSMECQDGRKLIVSRERKTLEYYETKTDPRELKNLIDTWTEAQLDAVASPMVDFLARGANTYARRL